MVKGLIKIGLLLVAGILVYNFFFGTKAEKEKSQEVFQQTGKLVGSAWDLLKSEKDKFNAGKYDQALDKVGGAYRAIREQAQHLDSKVLGRLDELEKRKATLEKEIDALEQADQQASTTPAPTKKGVTKPTAQEQQAATKAAETSSRKQKLLREMDKLMNDTDELIKDAQEQ